MLRGLKRWFGWYPEEEGAQPGPQSEQAAQQDARQHVASDRRQQRADPLLEDCPACTAGVQGLDWYTESLLRDEDGDVAHGFLEEPRPPSTNKTASKDKQQQQQDATEQSRPEPARLAGKSFMLVDKGNVMPVILDD